MSSSLDYQWWVNSELVINYRRLNSVSFFLSLGCMPLWIPLAYQLSSSQSFWSSTEASGNWSVIGENKSEDFMDHFLLNRSLNMEQEARERENDPESSKSNRSSSNEASKSLCSSRLPLMMVELKWIEGDVVKGSLGLLLWSMISGCKDRFMWENKDAEILHSFHINYK